jgi:hypothetical protein
LNKPQDVIARFPNLQVLRLTQPPLAVIEEEEEEDDDLFRERQWRYHSFAEPSSNILPRKANPSSFWPSAPRLYRTRTSS